ncbi:MAG: penicillin-binding protein 2 [Bdellovibrionaceae bacterium]|nr:penicillin-binding protein 2 [Pseudobdellovibrionaceae bacterium]
MAEYVSNPDEAKEYWGRYKFFYFFIAMTFVIFSIRLWYLQIISGNELREFSEKNRIKQLKIPAPRGLILDRQGKVLVQNLPGFEVVLSPQYIQSLDELATTVGPIIGLEPEKIVARVQRSRRINGPFALIKLKENLSREEVFRLKRIHLDTPGLEIRETILRHYPLYKNGAQLFGYVSEISKKQLPLLNELYKGIIRFEQGDIIGKSGIEENLEKDIRGSDGISFIQVDAHGRETSLKNPNILGEKITDQDATHGNNAVLTIDRDIQEAAYASFKKLDRIGGLVAMKSDGQVLAWLSEPAFDPNEFAATISTQTWSQLINDPFKPMRNKVIQDHHSPGSTFKPFVALAALEEKKITETQIVYAPGVFYFGKRPYHDHQKGGHGYINIYDALERSSNVFFYQLGIKLGIDKMFDYISLLGIGQKTGIELAREVPGNMPNSAWKKQNRGEEWQEGENLSTAIGQGFVETTLLQMTLAYNTIGLKGKVYRPYVIQKIVDQEGKVLKENFPQLQRDLTQTQPNGVKISDKTFSIVREGMRRVANGDRGTARFWKIPGVQMAGKTGTAQVMGFSADQIYANCMSRPVHMRHHGWFVAFAPADNPEITVGVLAEHSCHGNTGAAPIVRDVIQAYFQKYHPEVIAEATKTKKVTKEHTAEKAETTEDE